MDLTLATAATLFVVALVAGSVDAIAGGGGLITLPALLAAGLAPHVALATNKGQAVFGALAASTAYVRAGAVDRPMARFTFPAGFLGSIAGASLVVALAPATLRPVVLVLLAAAAVAAAVQRPGTRAGVERKGPIAWIIAAGIAFVLGAYDGFFGPGTGTFLIMAFVLALGTPMARAAADARIVNLASNLAALMVFARQGTIVWAIALPMAAAQLLGGVAGARLAVRGGAKLVRAAVLGVTAALIVKLAWDLYRG